MAKTVYITAWQAWRQLKVANCCNCGDSAGDAPEVQVWVIWGERLWCPKCARSHGLVG